MAEMSPIETVIIPNVLARVHDAVTDSLKLSLPDTDVHVAVLSLVEGQRLYIASLLPLATLTQALGHAQMDMMLDEAGESVVFTEPPVPQPYLLHHAVAELLECLQGGEVKKGSSTRFTEAVRSLEVLMHTAQQRSN